MKTQAEIAAMAGRNEDGSLLEARTVVADDIIDRLRKADRIIPAYLADASTLNGEWVRADLAEDAAVEILRLRFRADELERALNRAEAETAELINRRS